jgi:hypothetical protein
MWVALRLAVPPGLRAAANYQKSPRSPIAAVRRRPVDWPDAAARIIVQPQFIAIDAMRGAGAKTDTANNDHGG